jgi:hypothetical protein
MLPATADFPHVQKSVALVDIKIRLDFSSNWGVSIERQDFVDVAAFWRGLCILAVQIRLCFVARRE